MSNPGYTRRSYQSFILRLWQERSANSARPAVWRFSLEDPRTRQRWGFGRLEDLTAFLQDQIMSFSDAAEGGDTQKYKSNKFRRSQLDSEPDKLKR